jgi:hypothetical protein
VWHSKVHGQVRTSKIDIQRTIPLVRLQLVDRGPDPVYPGVGEHDVEPAKALDSCIDRTLDRVGITDITVDIQYLLALSGQLIAQALAFLGLHIRQGHLCAFFGKAASCASADSARRAGNKGDLAFEHGHDHLPP